VSECRFIIGDSLEVLRSMPADSVDLVVTSPPFLALRSYLPADHPDKGKEIGSEATPGAFIDVLLDVVEELDRVLAPHGSICIELGDTYAGSGGAGGDYNEDGLREGQPAFIGSARRGGGDEWPEPKSLCMIPQSFAWALAYGRNPFTGRETPRWRVRNIIRWCRSNPPVGALGDKFRNATSEMVVACKSRTRYFDLDSVRTEYSPNTNARTAKGVTQRPNTDKSADDEGRGGNFSTLNVVNNDGAGAPPLDFWVDTWGRVVERLTKAMLPERVCNVCGEPSRRIVEPTERYAERLESHSWASGGKERGHAKPASSVGWDDGSPVSAERTTTGWTDCGHNDWRAGVGYDPFAGTTGDDMSECRFIIGDSLEVLRSMPADSVDLVVTSPPFLALRSYLPADHPDKGKEIGSEATPGAFIDVLLDVVEELDRVLAPHGSICIELGDTYAGSGGSGGDYNADGLRDGQEKFSGSKSRTGWHRPPTNPDHPRTKDWRQEVAADSGTPNGGSGWPLDKSLSLIPQSFAWALAYGRNPFTGRETPRWRVRNIIRWCRPNPPVGALGDKFRPATSEMVVACKSRTRYFDLDAVRTEHQSPPHSVGSAMVNGQPREKSEGMSNPAGAPPLDFWVIPTAPYKNQHYATFPPALITKPIESMTPRRVCRVCGEPSRRIVESVHDVEHNRDQRSVGTSRGWNESRGDGGSGPFSNAEYATLGWTDCGHNDWRRGICLDPFGGSGTTGAVATGHGRDAILIDLDERNAELAIQRLGMFLTVEHHAPPEQCERCGAAGPTPHESTCPAA